MATLRRSSAKLRSLGSGHADLILAISQWKELRSATKSLMAAQESTSNDLLKWSSKEVCSTYLTHYSPLIQCRLSTQSKWNMGEILQFLV